MSTDEGEASTSNNSDLQCNYNQSRSFGSEVDSHFLSGASCYNKA